MRYYLHCYFREDISIGDDNFDLCKYAQHIAVKPRGEEEGFSGQLSCLCQESENYLPVAGDSLPMNPVLFRFTYILLHGLVLGQKELSP